MGNPVQLQIRGEDEVRDKFTTAYGVFDMDTYGDLTIALATFALENESEFRRHIQKQPRGDGAPRSKK